MSDIAVKRSVVVVSVCLCVVGALLWASKGRPGLGQSSGEDSRIDASAMSSEDRRVVVAELFTSEGCSSCPPADQVLSQLVRESLSGTLVLGLGEHVNYWDRLGWRDPFSSPTFSSRQSEYQSRVFRTGSIYTPQLVIDGQFEAIGSDIGAVRRAIDQATRVPKAAIRLAAWPADAGHLGLHVLVDLPPEVTVREEADVVVALTQDHLATDVRRGENRGRRLSHSAVVRHLTTLGSFKPPLRTFETTATVPVASDWALDAVRVIGLLQERQSRRIVGAGSARANGRKGPPPAD